MSRFIMETNPHGRTLHRVTVGDTGQRDSRPLVIHVCGGTLTINFNFCI